MQEAFEYMLKLIQEGVEYPDAEWKASSTFKVSNTNKCPICSLQH